MCKLHVQIQIYKALVKTIDFTPVDERHAEKVILLCMLMCAITRFLAWLINSADILWKVVLVTRFSTGR